MEEISIKIDLANRQYPLKIRKDAEERVRRAARLISERMGEYEQNYAVNDKFDLVAMCLIHFATEWVHLSEDTDKDKHQTGSDLAEVDTAIADYLASIARVH